MSTKPKLSSLYKAMRIAYYGMYDLSEPHNTTHLLGLRKSAAQLVEIHLPPQGERDNIATYRSPIRLLQFATHFILGSLRLSYRLAREKHIDAVIVGYPGYFDLPLAALISRFKGIPVILNLHISLYETLVCDRNVFRPKSLFGRFLKAYDRFLLSVSRRVLSDTNSHADWYAETYGVPRDKFQRVFIGADPIFKPLPGSPPADFTVLFYGTFIPLQGIEYIIEAATLLRDQPDIRFEIIGRGQMRDEMVAKARKAELSNVEFIDWVERETLVEKINSASVCLGGQFGLSAKADRVIGYKCFQMLACGRPVLVANSRGNCELLESELNCLMCAPGSGRQIANSILRLYKEPALRERIAAGALAVIEQHCSLERIGSELLALTESERQEMGG